MSCQRRGWRISLALAAVPGSILLLGGIFLPNTPNSLVELGRADMAKSVLQRVRGTKDVDEEFDSIIIADKAVRHLENPWRNIMRCALGGPSSSVAARVAIELYNTLMRPTGTCSASIARHMTYTTKMC